jgi:D-alanyl-D-alanine carboxypeptidase
MKVLTLIAVVLVGLVLANAGGSAMHGDSIRPLLNAVVAAGTPGAVVLIEDAAGRREAASGLAVLEGRVPLRVSDRFRAGSITKSFVAVVVLQLVAEHRLRLGDTVERWLPGLVPGGGAITVRELLGHTSGLADYVDAAFLARTLTEPRRAWTPRELVRLALAVGAVARPGERFAYASTNYILLGLIVERVTGTAIERQLRRRIFAPLGLGDTTFVPGPRIPGHHAHGYAPSQHDGIVSSLATARDRSTASASWAWAAGAIVSSAADLSRFFGVLLRGGLLPARLVALARPGPGARYGLGLAAFHTSCGTAVGHTGNLLGTVSAVWSSPDGRRRVVAMTNSYPLAPSTEAALRRLLNAAFCTA